MAAGRHRRQPDRRDGQGAAVPRRLQRLDHADQGPHRHARRPASARRSASRCSAPTWPRWRSSPARSKPSCKTVPGTSSAYAERVHRRLLPRHRARPRSARALRPDGRRRAGRRSPRRSAARPSPRPSKAASATPSTSATRAICAATRRRSPRDVLVPLPGGGTVPLGEVATIKLTRGPTTIRTENGQLAVYIYVDIRDRDLGGYVADAQKAVAERGEVPAGLLRRLERPVRISRARRSPAEDRGAGDAADHLPAALSQLPPAHRDADRHAVAAVRAGRRPLADVVARLQSVGRGRGRLHRAGRRRRRDRRHHADLSRSRLAELQAAAPERKARLHARRTCTRRSCAARSSGCGRR